MLDILFYRVSIAAMRPLLPLVVRTIAAVGGELAIVH
jgi:hypothetical protein